jgi:hypothetical protein
VASTALRTPKKEQKKRKGEEEEEGKRYKRCPKHQ